MDIQCTYIHILILGINSLTPGILKVSEIFDLHLSKVFVLS